MASSSAGDVPVPEDDVPVVSRTADLDGEHYSSISVSHKWDNSKFY